MASSAEEGRSPSPSSPWRLSRSQSLSPPRRLSRSPSPARGRSALSSSPPSRPRSRSWSPRSPLPSPPQAKAEKRSFYMFFDHGAGAIGLSLCTVEVEIPSVYSPSFPLRPIPIPIVPTLLFRATDFPTPMRCVHLGSKFYFLGGEISVGSDDELKSFSRDQLYPPNVYIFDPTTPKARANANANANAEAKNAIDFVTLGTPMKTGKPSPLLLFVAFGKIYALSSPLAARAFLNDLEYFEVFDPNTNQWASLPPPRFKYYHLHTHALVKSKVYIMAPSEFKLHCFDLNKEEWEPSMPLLSSQFNFPRLRLTDLMADIAEDSLYGFGFLYRSLVALGPVKATELADGECFNNLIHILPVGMLPRWNGLGKLLHLGHKRICYVESAHPVVSPATTMDPFDIRYNAQTLYIGLTIFEALSDTFAHQDHSEAKLLLPAVFVAKIPWDTHPAHLCNCSLIPIAANDAGFNGEAEL